MIPVENASCLLCQETFNTVNDIRLHRISQKHMDHVNDFNKQIEEIECEDTASMSNY